MALDLPSCPRPIAAHRPPPFAADRRRWHAQCRAHHRAGRADVLAPPPRQNPHAVHTCFACPRGSFGFGTAGGPSVSCGPRGGGPAASLSPSPSASGSVGAGSAGCARGGSASATRRIGRATAGCALPSPSLVASVPPSAPGFTKPSCLALSPRLIPLRPSTVGARSSARPRADPTPTTTRQTHTPTTRPPHSPQLPRPQNPRAHLPSSPICTSQPCATSTPRAPPPTPRVTAPRRPRSRLVPRHYRGRRSRRRRPSARLPRSPVVPAAPPPGRSASMRPVPPGGPGPGNVPRITAC